MIRYRILGPLELLDEESRPVPIGGPRESVLLATLLLGANRVVSSDRLIEALWGEDPPPTASNALQVHISKLRKTLAAVGAGGALLTKAPGYMLVTSIGELDAELFERLAAPTGTEGPDELSSRLGEALGLWRGAVLEGVDAALFGRSDVTRLEELRSTALERRIEADLILGRHASLVGELEGLVRSNPLREQLRGQLMLALYRSGRQAEALRVYTEGREILAEELGIQPSRSLQDLELAILNQSPELRSPQKEFRASSENHPSGTVTLMFTDVEGSTRLWEQVPDAMAEALRKHDDLLRSTIERFGGYVFKTVGDAFCAAFSRAKDAVSAAGETQRALFAQQWPQDAELRVRMALHTGECEERDGDYFGPTVNRVARLESVAYGGQVVLTRATADIVGDSLSGDFGLRNLGTHRLKDLSRPEEIFELLVQGLESDFPPLRSLDNPNMQNNLPELVSSFVGRASELEDVRAMIDQTRLVTLVGPGGVGKTRLALQVAAELLDGSGDGVWLVELAGLTEPDAVPVEVARVLGIKEQSGSRLYESLVDALADHFVLILLDNCEHLIGASAKLADVLLRGCPRVYLLATSREALGIDGETVYRVLPLSLPAADQEDPSSVLGSEAVSLFVERARAHSPEFGLTGESAPVVAHICRRLDGMPLAIELAVARLKSLGLSDLSDRLDRRFQLLTGGSRSALPRQQTLRAVVDWSYDLLTDPERTLFRRLSVFASGFELRAVEAICGFRSLEDFDVSVLLGSLAEKSLVVTDASGLTIRYRLLETIRQYSAERLAEIDRDEISRLSDLFCDYYVSYVEQAAPTLTGPEQDTETRRLATEYPNIYAAFERLCEDGGRQEPALRLAVALRLYWLGAGATSSEALLLGRALEHFDTETPTPLVAAAKMARATLLRSSDLVASGESSREAVELAREGGDPKLLGDTLSFHSFSTLLLGHGQLALSLANEAVNFARQSGDPISISSSLNALANAVEDSDAPQAERLYLESIGLAEESGNWSALWRSRNNIGYLFMTIGRLEEAREQLESALVAASRVGAEVYTAFSRGNLGWVLFREGDIPAATNSFILCIRSARRCGQVRRVFSNVTCGLAVCASSAGDLERAAVLHGIGQTAVEAYGGDWDGNELEIREGDIAHLKRVLGGSFDRNYESGQAMERDRAIAFVIDS